MNLRRWKNKNQATTTTKLLESAWVGKLEMSADSHLPHVYSTSFCFTHQTSIAGEALATEISHLFPSIFIHGTFRCVSRRAPISKSLIGPPQTREWALVIANSARETRVWLRLTDENAEQNGRTGREVGVGVGGREWGAFIESLTRRENPCGQ